MFNSINNPHRRKEDNPMNSLSFVWQALFEDGTQINQFDSNEIEYRFQEVVDRFDKLAFFNLTNKAGKMFTVNLQEGLLGYNDLVISYRKSEEEKRNIRLIFFRRHKVDLNAQLEELNHNIEYHLGYQYNDNEGKNRQITIIIDKDGNWYLGG